MNALQIPIPRRSFLHGLTALAAAGFMPTALAKAVADAIDDFGTTSGPPASSTVATVARCASLRRQARSFALKLTTPSRTAAIRARSVPA